MAEGILNFKARPQFTACSAGSHPSGEVRPEALRQLAVAHTPAKGCSLFLCLPYRLALKKELDNIGRR